MYLSTIRKLGLVLAMLCPLLLLTACDNPSYDYKIGGTLSGLTGSGVPGSVVLQNNGGDNLTLSVNGSFTFASTVHASSFTDANYNVTILKHPQGQTCTVTGGSGKAKADITNVVVNCGTTAASLAVYVANSGSSNNVAQFSISSTGVLSASPTSTASTNIPPTALVIDATNKYLYVAYASNNTITQFNLGSAGVLPSTPTSTVSTVAAPKALAIDPTGKYLYVAVNGNNTILQYTLGTDGRLPTTITTTATSGISPNSITIDRNGQYVYVANYGDGISNGTLTQYTIGAAGALPANPTTTVATGLNPYSVALDPAVSHVYVSNSSDNTLYQYTLGAAGALPASHTASAATGLSPTSVIFDPTGNYIYVANSAGNSLSQYTLGSGAALPATATSSVSTGAGTAPNAIAMDATGLYIYSANYTTGTISQFTIGAAGALPASAAATVGSGGTNPVDIILSK